jgi:uncharacterized protein YkwD
LKTAKPISACPNNPLLVKAAQFHVNDAGPKGIIGHNGTANSTMSSRISAQGDW